MGNAIFIHKTGGTEVLSYEAYDPGLPDGEEVLVRQEAIGVNFIDIYHRTGLYPLPGLPAIIGLEGAGVVEVVGPDVSEFQVNDRVAYAGVPPGGYADVRKIPAHRLVKLPESITSPQAAAMMLRGMTARYLLKGCYPVKKGDRILIHAAAGGVGSIVCQWAKHLGATVYGTVGSSEKAKKAKTNGCDHPILYDQEDFVQKIKELTDGKGVDVVYDSVGKATFMKSLDCLRPMGMMVSFGQSSGTILPVDLGLLAAKGSLFLTRPSLMAYTAKRNDLLAHAQDLFEVVEKGAVKIEIGQAFPLKDAALAHASLEGRKTTASTLLIP